MQINIIRKTVKIFDPIELSFTIQSKRELEFFLALLNASGNSLADFANEHIPSIQINNKSIDKFNGSEGVSALKAKETWDKLKTFYNES